jgi:hypothetical protein
LANLFRVAPIITFALALGCVHPAGGAGGPRAAAAPAPGPPGPAVRVEGSRLLVEDRPATLFGFRVGSAPLREEWTRELIGTLDLWRRHGVNGLILWLQGTSGGYARVFTPEGRVDERPAPILVRSGYGIAETKTRIGEVSGRDVVARALRIVDAAAAHGMVVVVGIAYRHAILPSDTPETITSAMRAGAAPFADRPNVVIDLWNEARDGRRLEAPEDMRAYARAVRAVAPRRPICVGSNHQAANLAYAPLPEIDLVCQDAGDDPASAARFMDELKRFGKPVVNVESFGASGGGYVDVAAPPRALPASFSATFTARGGFHRVYGAFEEDAYADALGRRLVGRRGYRDLIARVARDPDRQLHLMLHVAGWFQGASRTENAAHIAETPGGGRWTNVFGAGDPDADGTIDRPGIAWILRAVAGAR